MSSFFGRVCFVRPLLLVVARPLKSSKAIKTFAVCMCVAHSIWGGGAFVVVISAPFVCHVDEYCMEAYYLPPQN